MGAGLADVMSWDVEGALSQHALAFGWAGA